MKQDLARKPARLYCEFKRLFQKLPVAMLDIRKRVHLKKFKSCTLFLQKHSKQEVRSTLQAKPSVLESVHEDRPRISHPKYFQISGFAIIFLLVGQVITRDYSSVWIRLLLLSAYLIVFLSLILAGYWSHKNAVSVMLFLASTLFLLWRFSFVNPQYLERALNSETVVFGRDYDTSAHLAFGNAHSYFFLVPLTLDFLYEVGSISPLNGIYIALAVYGILTAVTSNLILRAIWKHCGVISRSVGAAMAPVVAFSLVSFMYSERSLLLGGFPNIAQLLLPLAMWVVSFRGLERRSQAVVLLMLTGGVTLGSIEGIIILSLFFIFYSIYSARTTALVYALLPLGYLSFSAYDYTVNIVHYATFASEGLTEFLKRVISGEPLLRVVPWERTTLWTMEDAVVASIGYLSLLLLAFVVAIISTYLLLTPANHVTDNHRTRPTLSSYSTCLWATLFIAGATYVGASIKPEVSFSDIRTIAIVFPSLLLPFTFGSRRFFTKVTAKRMLSIFLVGLMLLASLRTSYELYPKSLQDPVNVVEDVRLGSTSIYAAGSFILNYYWTGGISSDYKTLIRLGSILPTSRYQTRLLDEPDHIGEKCVLVFNVLGSLYPSVFHSLDTYRHAHNFAITHNIVYSGGAVLVAPCR